MDETMRKIAGSYSPPRLLAEDSKQGIYGSIIWVIVAVTLLMLIGPLAVCLSLGFDGVALQISIDERTVKLGCVNNP